MTSITWAGPKCVQEPAAISAPQNRTQGHCDMYIGLYCVLYMLSAINSMSGVTLQFCNVSQAARWAAVLRSSSEYKYTQYTAQSALYRVSHKTVYT